MTRVSRAKLTYFAVLFLVGLIGYWILTRIQNPSLIILLVFVLLIPGRIQGYFWRNFYQGKKRLLLNEFEESIKYSQAFLVDLQNRPWLKKLSWITWQVYTSNLEAMTLNNIGVAQLQLGQWNNSENMLMEAIELDDDYPKPYYGLALLYKVQGFEDKANEFIVKARERGFKGTFDDVLLSRLGNILARVEG